MLFYNHFVRLIFYHTVKIIIIVIVLTPILYLIMGIFLAFIFF